MRLYNFKIGTRLGAAFALVVVMSAALAANGIYKLQSAKSTLQRVASIEFERTSKVQAWVDNVNINLVRTMAYLETNNPETAKRLLADMAETSNKSSVIQAALTAQMTAGSGPRMLANLAKERNTYVALRKLLLDRKAAGEDVTSRVESQLRPAAAAYLAVMSDFDKHSDELLDQLVAEAASDATTSQWTMGGTTVAVLLVCTLAAIRVTQSIIHPLARAVNLAETISAGKLNSRVDAPGCDEVAQLLQALAVMQQNLVEIVERVRTGSLSVAGASAQIAAGNQDLSSRTEQQATALEETAASMDELTSTVKANSDNSEKANRLATDASKVAGASGVVVTRMSETMSEISAASHKISEIVGVIEGIAFQTNILALNAAVEAAHAGDQGRGFAVVATEVRSLAHRAGAAAKEIKDLSSHSMKTVTTGGALVAEASAAIGQVVAHVGAVANIMNEITMASYEQSQGIAEVNEAVSQMDNVTQQNASLVEEAAAAAASMEDQAKSLVEVVSAFQV